VPFCSDGSLQLRGDLGDGGADLHALVADNRKQVVRVDCGCGVQGVRQQGAAADGVQHLGGGGLHPGSGACGEHDDRRRARRDSFCPH